jgi:hypothetical protein
VRAAAVDVQDNNPESAARRPASVGRHLGRKSKTRTENKE